MVVKGLNLKLGDSVNGTLNLFILIANWDQLELQELLGLRIDLTLSTKKRELLIRSCELKVFKNLPVFFSCRYCLVKS